MILYEDMKLIEHVPLQPIRTFSPDVCMQKLFYKVVFIWLNTLKLLMTLSLQNKQI